MVFTPCVTCDSCKTEFHWEDALLDLSGGAAVPYCRNCGKDFSTVRGSFIYYENWLPPRKHIDNFLRKMEDILDKAWANDTAWFFPRNTSSAAAMRRARRKKQMAKGAAAKMKQ